VAARGRRRTRPAPPLGAHVSVAGGLPLAIDRAVALGCQAIQIFVKNANRWEGRPLAEEEVLAFRGAWKASGVGAVFAHASYLINLAASEPVVLARSRVALADELERCRRLGLSGLVLHPGAHRGAGEAAGLDRVVTALDAVLDAAPAAPRVLLENTAGQGSCLGGPLAHLEELRRRVREPHRVGICIDTCHAFAAGYPVHRPGGWQRLVDELERRGLLADLGLVHLNDSRLPFGSRRDRHAHIGAGAIGAGAFARLLAVPQLRDVPMVIETDPEEEMAGLRADLATLTALR
jgi:deoxyribonuclease-4